MVAKDPDRHRVVSWCQTDVGVRVRPVFAVALVTGRRKVKSPYEVKSVAALTEPLTAFVTDSMRDACLHERVSAQLAFCLLTLT